MKIVYHQGTVVIASNNKIGLFSMCGKANIMIKTCNNVIKVDSVGVYGVVYQTAQSIFIWPNCDDSVLLVENSHDMHVLVSHNIVSRYNNELTICSPMGELLYRSCDTLDIADGYNLLPLSNGGFVFTNMQRQIYLYSPQYTLLSTKQWSPSSDISHALCLAELYDGNIALLPYGIEAENQIDIMHLTNDVKLAIIWMIGEGMFPLRDGRVCIVHCKKHVDIVSMNQSIVSSIHSLDIQAILQMRDGNIAVLGIEYLYIYDTEGKVISRCNVNEGAAIIQIPTGELCVVTRGNVRLMQIESSKRYRTRLTSFNQIRSLRH